MRSALIVRHLAFEDLGAFEPGLREAGYEMVYCDAGVDKLDALSARSTDLAIVLGGPISANDVLDFPFLRDELRLLRARLDANQPTMGICLGAQLIARALGQSVYPATAAEIGFAPIELTADGASSCLAPYAQDPLALHWHGETFDLPRGAVRLASTRLCPNQAFALGPRVIGFQFHPEASRAGFERWLIGHIGELRRHGIAPGMLRRAADDHATNMETKAREVLRKWLSGLH
jgi:GMP synthase (glutamine-hydrolysing)